MYNLLFEVVVIVFSIEAVRYAINGSWEVLYTELIQYRRKNF